MTRTLLLALAIVILLVGDAWAPPEPGGALTTPGTSVQVCRIGNAEGVAKQLAGVGSPAGRCGRAVNGTLATVVDATSKADCTTGNGAVVTVCQYDAAQAGANKWVAAGSGGGGEVTLAGSEVLTNKTIAGGENIAASTPSINNVRRRNAVGSCLSTTAAAHVLPGDECYSDSDNVGWECVSTAAGTSPDYCDNSADWRMSGWTANTYLKTDGIYLTGSNYLYFDPTTGHTGKTIILAEEPTSASGNVSIHIPSDHVVGSDATFGIYESITAGNCVVMGSAGLLEDSNVVCSTGAITDDQTASEVANTPHGSISATTVQGAINDLEDRKADATDVAGYGGGSVSPVGSASCTTIGDLYKQSGTTPQTLWVCQSTGSPGTWAPLTPAELGAWIVRGASTTGYNMRTLASGVGVTAPTLVDGATLLAGEDWIHVMMSLPATVNRVIVYNSIAMTATDGCTFQLQKVTAGGTASDITAGIIEVPASSTTVSAKTMTEVTFTSVALVAGDFLRVKVSDGPHCSNGSGCVCDETDSFQFIATGTR